MQHRHAPKSITELAQEGRGGDQIVGHLTPGDVVVPAAIAHKDPAILMRLKKNFEEEGQDYRTHIAGTKYNSINPETGIPEFRFGGGWLKPLATAVGFAFGGPPGAALASGGTSLAQGEGLKGAALSAGGAYLGSSFLGTGAGDIAGNLTGNALTRGLGESLAGTTLGGLGVNGLSGALAGNTITSMLGKSMTAPVDNGKGGATPGENLDISRPDEMALPGDLSASLGSLDPLQRTTNIATQGTQGQGASPEARDYFLNQVQRRLTDTTPGNLQPVEGQYLDKLGVNYTPGDTKSILQGIARSKILQS